MWEPRGAEEGAFGGKGSWYVDPPAVRCGHINEVRTAHWKSAQLGKVVPQESEGRIIEGRKGGPTWVLEPRWSEEDIHKGEHQAE